MAAPPCHSLPNTSTGSILAIPSCQPVPTSPVQTSRDGFPLCPFFMCKTLFKEKTHFLVSEPQHNTQFLLRFWMSPMCPSSPPTVLLLSSRLFCLFHLRNFPVDTWAPPTALPLAVFFRGIFYLLLSYVIGNVSRFRRPNPLLSKIVPTLLDSPCAAFINPHHSVPFLHNPYLLLEFHRRLLLTTFYIPFLPQVSFW